MAAILETLSDLVIVVDQHARITYASQASDRLLRRPAAFLLEQPIGALIHPEDRPTLNEMLATLGAIRPTTAVPLGMRVSHLNGEWIDMEATATDLRTNAAVQGVVLELRDVRPRREFEEALRHQTKHDPLTRLANRTLFQEVLSRALTRPSGAPRRPHALLFMDLDGFKRINDSLGHASGDMVLRMLADRIRTRVRPGDTAARLGGDEFAILLESSSEADAEAMAHRILEAVGQPYRVQNKELFLSASLGIALTTPGQTAEELLRDADVAMYEAKTAGKAQYAIFRPEMQLAARRRLDMEDDLRRAIEHREFTLCFQPIFTLSNRRTVGAEVLVRWRHPLRGTIPPLDFISVSEESGLIVPLGRWIFEEACAQAREWFERFPQMVGAFGVNINVSVRQIEHEGFLQMVQDTLRDNRLDPGTVTVEITESLIMRDFDRAVDRLNDLKGCGVRIAIDDFGTGYSSLRYLKSLPVDELKIDKTFVDDVADGPEPGAVALAVIKLARTFGLSTLAEGIEKEAQVNALRKMGADLGQGFLFARPMDAATMDAFLARKFG